MAILSRQITPTITEIYVNGGGNYITQSRPTNFHQFFTRKVLTGSETIDDFREVTEAQRTQLENSDAEAQAYAKVPYTLDKRIRRGVIPFKARRGIVYYDMGAVKLTWNHWAPIGNSEIVSDTVRVFDLSRFADLIGDNASVSVFVSNGDGGIVKANWCKSHLSYDQSEHLLTLNGSKEDWQGAGIIVSRTYLPQHGNISRCFNCQNVVYFDKYMQLQRAYAGTIGASEFTHTLSSEAAAAFVYQLRPEYDGSGRVTGSRLAAGGIHTRIWRYKRQVRHYGMDKDAEWYMYYRFAIWHPMYVENTYNLSLYDNRKTRLFRVQLKSRKGYKSRMVRVSRSFIVMGNRRVPFAAVAID